MPKNRTYTAVLALLVTFALAAAAGAKSPPGDPAAERSRDSLRCFERKQVRRKTSLGVHQWTAEHVVGWCARGDRIVSVVRRPYQRTGTNWRHISTSGWSERNGRGAMVVQSRFHFRLRYPHFEQNCRPRLTLAIDANGDSTGRIETGC